MRNNFAPFKHRASNLSMYISSMQAIMLYKRRHCTYIQETGKEICNHVKVLTQ